MEENERTEDLFLNEDESRKVLNSILPKVKGDLNDEETFKFAFGLKMKDYKTKAEQNKVRRFESKTLKTLNLVLKRILKSKSKILCFDDTTKVMKTEFLAPVQELLNYDGDILIRSPRIEMGYSGAYYYYDVRSNEYVLAHYNEKTKVLKNMLRKDTENELLLELERKDKGTRFGFKKIPIIPQGFVYDSDEQGN